MGVAAAACCCETDPPEDSCPYWGSVEFERFIQHQGNQSTGDGGSIDCSAILYHTGRLWMRGGTDGQYQSIINPPQQIGYNYQRLATFPDGLGFIYEAHELVDDPIDVRSSASSNLQTLERISPDTSNCPDIELGSPMLVRNVSIGYTFYVKRTYQLVLEGVLVADSTTYGYVDGSGPQGGTVSSIFDGYLNGQAYFLVSEDPNAPFPDRCQLGELITYTSRGYNEGCGGWSNQPELKCTSCNYDVDTCIDANGMTTCTSREKIDLPGEDPNYACGDVIGSFTTNQSLSIGNWEAQDEYPF